MPTQDTEWLVTDQQGAFAMGTREGFRSRKYHGFLMGVPSRTETAYLVDFEIECNGRSLWPHCYSSLEGPIIHPNPVPVNCQFEYELLEEGPEWSWTLPDGKLQFRVQAGSPQGIALSWTWHSKSKKKQANLRIRGFWAFRDLHALGGHSWTTLMEPGQIQLRSQNGKQAYLRLEGDWSWTEDPHWYRHFHYFEEAARGYDPDEDLYSQGVLQIQLKPSQSCEWLVSPQPSDKTELQKTKSKKEKGRPSRTTDFILHNPAGIIAGYPWFGEWGRDTFVSLPGIVASVLKAEDQLGRIETWSYELLHRWGSWIQSHGMLPNVLGARGEPYWDSADATLWWCHSLACLWMFSLVSPFPFSKLKEEYKTRLDQAIESIRQGKHRHLRENAEGLLEVISPHATWMDAKVDGIPVTPRTGCLPEINALWFEARCLQWLWHDMNAFEELKELGRRALQCSEPDRPNSIFLHSLPLAPTFVLNEQASLKQDLCRIAESFWTPVGLRTLTPASPDFIPRCIGTQTERDAAYHQGPVWAWLGGQYEMARSRLEKSEISNVPDKMFTEVILEEMPVYDHIPELFDAEPPYTPRGTPAQAWSLACLEESKARRRFKVDMKMSKAIQERKARDSSVKGKLKSKRVRPSREMEM